MLVQTLKGDIDHTELEVRERVWFEANARNIHIEWFHNGEFVRSDGVAIALKTQNISGQQQGV